MRKRIWITGIMFAAAALSVQAQLVTVKSSFSADSVMLGEQLEYYISVRSAPGIRVNIPVFADTLTRDIEILEAQPPDTLLSGNSREIIHKYLVTSFTPGWNTVPPLPVAFSTEELADTIHTTVQLLTVLAPAVDTTQAIRPIKPPVNTPISLAEIMPYAAAGMGALLLVTLIAALIWIRTTKREHPELFARPPEPAHMEAFRELSRLKAEKLPQKGMVKEYYSRLTEIVRIYMARQFGIHAMESTSREILEAFASQNTTDKTLNASLEELLMLADLVKFAKEDPAPAENEANFAHAESFVEKTYRMFYREDQEKPETDVLETAGESIDVEPGKPEVRHE